MEVTLEQLNHFKLPLKMLKIFPGGMPADPLGATPFSGHLSKPLFVKSWIRPAYSRLEQAIVMFCSYLCDEQEREQVAWNHY